MLFDLFNIPEILNIDVKTQDTIKHSFYYCELKSSISAVFFSLNIQQVAS